MFFQINIKDIFPKLFKFLVDYFYMSLTCFLNINQDIIKINNNKKIQRLGKNFFYVFLKTGCSIGQIKKYYLIFKLAISSIKCCLSLMTGFNFHLVVGTGQIKLSEPFSIPQLVQQLSYQRQGITILNRQVFQALIVNIQIKYHG